MPREPRLPPLVLATMASQGLLVVLAPTISAIADDLGASVATVGQARSIAAGVAIACSVAIAGRIDAIGVPRLLRFGAALAIVASGAVAASPTLAVFLASHVLVGLAFACLLSAGFAGVAAFRTERRAWAIGYVAGANALAWIVINPVVGVITDLVSWRVAEAVPAVVALGALALAGMAACTPRGETAWRLKSLWTMPSARRWIGAETIAYGGWTALLTFIGAFFMDELGVREAAAGWYLAAGALAYFAAATRAEGLARRMPRRQLAAVAAMAMAVLLVFQLSAGSVGVAVALFCLIGFTAGVRTPASSGLGLEQLPDHPGSMMAARTAATQLGYLLGAVVGGVVLAGPGYATLGVVLAAAMVTSALLVLRVEEPADVRARAPRHA